jgi:GntR family transcriptional regulator
VAQRKTTVKTAVDRPTRVSRAPLEQLDNSPLAARAREAILTAILENRFKDRLPSEDQLAEMLNVSRTTIRAALQSLERDGLIARRRAVGTTINRHVGPSTLALHRLVAFDWLLKEKGHDVSVEVSWERMDLPQRLASVSPFEAGSDCIVMGKKYRADGVLAIYIEDVVPVDTLENDDIQDPLPPSVFEFCDRYCHNSIDHAVVQIVPTKKAKRVTPLMLKEGEPFIRLHEVHYTNRAEVLAFSSIDVDDHFIRLEVFRRR